MKVAIEKMIYGGDGLARLAPNSEDSVDARPSPGGDAVQSASSSAAEATSSTASSHKRSAGKALFVPFTLAGETVEVEVVEERPGFARAEAVSVIVPSPNRVEPGCPYFGRCGGCHYQHAHYEHQLAIKRQILLETLRRTAGLELAVEVQVHASQPWHYRNRTRLRVRRAPARQAQAAEFALGYYAHGSHDFLPVEHCPISARLINRALQNLRRSPQFALCASAIAEVQFFTNHDESALLLELYTQGTGEAGVFQLLFDALRTELPELLGMALLQAPGRDANAFGLGRLADPLTDAAFAPRAVKDKRQPASSPRRARPQVLGASSLEYLTSAGKFRVSAGSFFQTNLFQVDELPRIVLAGRSGKHALDLYAGVGLFSAPLSGSFQQVTAVEISPAAAADLRVNTGGNVECLQASADQFLRGLRNPSTVDFIVVDPPRTGLGAALSRQLARTGTPRLTYVSCDPATLSRDLRVLLESGFHVEQAHLVDLFPQTFHMETVLHLAR